MIYEFLLLMKHELLLCGLLFAVLILKISESNDQNRNWTLIINVLLTLNFVAGFFFNSSGELFNGMFKTNDLLQLEKNILNLGLLIVSLQAFPWIKTHSHLP